MNKRSRFIYFTLYTLFTLFTSLPTHAQDSSRIRISLLTCTPGDELYSIFGHSALRIIDSNSVTDIVYNYGTFNFDDEGFYLKFIRGKLPYYISIARFDEFKFDYQTTNRGMTEQVLDFSTAEKATIQHSLIENLKEENKYYQYDFFLDNCTTRLRDIIIKNKQPTPLLPAVMRVTKTFRNAIHLYLDAGLQPWSKLGIDILLGAPTDAVMTPAQQQFLPDNLMIALDSSRNIKLVQSSENLYPFEPFHEKHWLTPMMFFCALLILFILLSISKYSTTQNILNGLDGVLFFLTGLLGILLIFMMTATDHSMTKNNYNIFWAWPTHVIAAFFINKKKRFTKYYFLAAAIGLALLLLLWFFLPQQMNNALIPFVILLIYRSAVQYLKH